MDRQIEQFRLGSHFHLPMERFGEALLFLETMDLPERRQIGNMEIGNGPVTLIPGLPE